MPITSDTFAELRKLAESKAVLDAFRRVEASTSQLCKAVSLHCVESTVVSVGNKDIGSIALDRSLDLFRTFEYQDGQGTDESRQLSGAIAVAPSVREAVDVVNVEKESLEAAMKALRAKLESDAGGGRRDDLVGAAITSIGLARIHLVQTVRKVIMLGEQPVRLGFFISTSERKLIPLSLDMVREQILIAGGDVDAFDMRRAEQPDLQAVRVTSLPPHTMCNVKYRGQDGYKLYRAPMPFLYPYEPGKPKPLISTPKNPAGRVRKERAGGTVDALPVLPGTQIFLRNIGLKS